MISVIIPTYNRAKYITEAIESVLVQTYTDYEIIVVDDGSSDDTEIIIENYKSKHKNIVYIRQTNSGPAVARNNGMRSARGEWIAFLDSDDIWDPIKLEYQMKCLKESNSLVCFSNHSTFENPSDIIKHPMPQNTDQWFEANISIQDFVLLKKHFQTSGIIFNSCLFPSKHVFDESLKFSGEDHKLYYDLFSRCPISYITESLYHLRRSSECPGFAVSNRHPADMGKIYDDMARAHAQGYFYYDNIRDPDTRRGIREIIGYQLLRRAEIACALKDFQGARYIALDSFFFSSNTRRKIIGLLLYLAPSLLSRHFHRKWFNQR